MTDLDRSQRDRVIALQRSICARLYALSLDSLRRLDRCLMREEMAEADRTDGMTDAEAIQCDFVLSMLQHQVDALDERIAAVDFLDVNA